MIEQEIVNKELDDFDINQAQKLLESIRHMGDIRKFPVQKPNSTTMEMTTLQEWVKWFVKTTEWNGSIGVENDMLKVINNLDSNMQIMVKRVEEGFRKLVTVLDRKEIKIKLLEGKLEEYQNKLEPKEEIIEEEKPKEEEVKPKAKSKFPGFAKKKKEDVPA